MQEEGGCVNVCKSICDQRQKNTILFLTEFYDFPTLFFTYATLLTTDIPFLVKLPKLLHLDHWRTYRISNQGDEIPPLPTYLTHFPPIKINWIELTSFLPLAPNSFYCRGHLSFQIKRKLLENSAHLSSVGETSFKTYQQSLPSLKSDGNDLNLNGQWIVKRTTIYSP